MNEEENKSVDEAKLREDISTSELILASSKDVNDVMQQEVIISVWQEKLIEDYRKLVALLDGRAIRSDLSGLIGEDATRLILDESDDLTEDELAEKLDAIRNSDDDEKEEE